MTLTLDQVIRHTVMFHLSTSTYISNFIGIGKTFCGRTDGHVCTYRPKSETHIIRSTLRSWPNKQTCKHTQITDIATMVWATTTHKSKIQRSEQVRLKKLLNWATVSDESRISAVREFQDAGPEEQKAREHIAEASDHRTRSLLTGDTQSLKICTAAAAVGWRVWINVMTANLGGSGYFISCIGHHTQSLERKDTQVTGTDHRLQHISTDTVKQHEKNTMTNIPNTSVLRASCTNVT